MGLRYTSPYFEWIDGSGIPVAGGLLYFYLTGTSTPLATYSDVTLTTPNANPVVADANGVWGPIYLQPKNYKVILKDANGVQIWSADPVNGSGGGVLSSAIRTTTVSSNVTTADGTVLVNSAGATNQTLPDPTDIAGLIFTIKNINTGAATVVGTIDGIANYVLAFQNQSISVQSNGVSYYVI